MTDNLKVIIFTMILGTTFSHLHAHYLRLSPLLSFTELIGMGFQSIRIACYWNEIERKQGLYDFSAIRSLLDVAQSKNQNVIVSIGMKAPRYPEYYFPEWLEEKHPLGAEPYLIPYLYKTIEELRSYNVITHWQVENEPLDPSGPKHLSIPVDLLQKEIDVIREKDKRPVLINLWGNELKKRQLLLRIKNRADVLGLDIYYKVPIFGPIYRGPQDNDDAIRRLMQGIKKPFFITELQAEPWERNLLVAKSDKTPSMNAVILTENYERALSLKPQAIYFWGSEYWLWRKKLGDMSLLTVVTDILKSS